MPKPFMKNSSPQTEQHVRPITKLFKAFAGLLLTVVYTKVFDLKKFKGKRIALVGPAESALNTGKGDYIDGFDIVIRINKSWLVVQSAKFQRDIGAKIDILFHCFFENEYSGGGQLDFKTYDDLGVKYVINPRFTMDGLRVIFNFYKKYLSTRKTHVLPFKFYRNLQRDFGKYRPTTGYAALYAILRSEFEELYLTGFTFFRTGYAPGYRDEMREKEQAQKYLKKMDIHNSDLEYEHFKKLLNRYKHKKIVLDPELKKILLSDTR